MIKDQFLASLLFSILFFTLSSNAFAAPIFDDTFLAIELQNDVHRPDSAKAADVNYQFALKARVFGVQNGDMLRVQWMQNGQKFDDVRVPMKVQDGVGKTGWSDRGWRQSKTKLNSSLGCLPNEDMQSLPSRNHKL